MRRSVKIDPTLYITLLAFAISVLFLYLLYSIFSPFLGVLVWAGAIGVITFPLYEKLLARCRGRETIAAALMTTAVVLALVIPLLGLIFTLTREAAHVYQYLERASSGSSGFALTDILNHPLLTAVREKIEPYTGTLNLELNEMVLPAIKKGVASILDYSTGIVKNFLGLLFKLVLMLITLFFMYQDGMKFLERFWRVVSISENLKTTIGETVARVLGAVMYGVILTCLVQGTLGGIGFWAAGLPSPFLFGTLMAICAPIPLVGTALIWLPGSIYLLMLGKTLHGLLLIAWGLLVVSGIDNIIRPLFISGRAKLPILVILFGVLGGILAFGLSGLVAGPVILAIILVFFEAGRGATCPSDQSANN